MTDDKKPQEKIVIEGVTEEGKKFRPSDWAERMSGKLATYKNRRLQYSPMLQPSINKAGNTCVLLDTSLRDTNPELYQSILEFAQNNQLKICENDEPESE
jgi:hypothetical protein